LIYKEKLCTFVYIELTMKKLKITLFQQKDNGETQILHAQWDGDVESEKKTELYNNIMTLIRKHNMEISEEEDKLKELR
jgi:hypothetical protein